MVRRRFSKTSTVAIELLAVVLSVCVADLMAQSQPAATSPALRQDSTRPCSANPVLPGSNAKKAARKPKNMAPLEAAPVCIELKGQPIEIQEFLQNMARKQAWRIGENRASEEAWSYVRYFDPEELGKYADTKVLIEPVNFADGKAAVTVRTSDLGDGYVRVQITTRFQGEGKSADRAAAQPASTWPLTSKGVLEQELVTALQSGFRPLE
jgi:hypothetical protein